MSDLTSQAVRTALSRLIVVTFVLVATLAPRGAAAQTLPSGWATSDVGSPAVAGRASYASSTFTVEGGGRDIWDPSDQFRFVYTQMSGDVTAIVRVTSLETTDPSWTKAGVMIRESLSGTSKHAFALLSSGKGLAFQRRASTGGTSANTSVSGTGPVWLRLQRQGTSFTASRSSNGTSWTQIGSATISMGSSVYVGLAVTSHNASTLATASFANVNISGGSGGGALPSGWTSSDIGSVAVAGSATYASSTFTVRGAGADIWNTSDQFRFAYRQVSGDVDVIARVATLSGPDEWSKAGVMVRASLSSNSAHAAMLTSVSNGHAYQRRPGTGLASVHTSGGSGTAPIWLKLERRGSAVTAFRSTNGSSWTMIDSQTLTLPSTFYVGLAVTSHNTSSAATATFTNVTVGAGSTTTPPTVSLTSPASGATFTAPANITISANASDSDNGVNQVAFYANGQLLGTDSSSPYSFSWSGVAAGSYSLTAVARDNGGLTTTSAARSITVNGGGGGNTPPTVSLTAPSSGATYTAPASVTISANASDSNGSVARVEFYAGASLVGTDTSSPYSVVWSNAPAGSYSLTAVAYDNAGASRTSGSRSITVNNPTQPSRAVFNPSPDHATVTRYVLDIFTAGANPNTATPMATQNLGKPSVVSGECSVNIATTINGLPSGSYFATLVAVGPGGTSARAQSGNFVR